MTPFIPKGSVAEWRLLYEEMAGLRPDDVLTIDRIEEILGRPLGQNRSPIYRATRELERNQSRTLATLRGSGYRIAHAREHLGLGLSHSSRARRSLKRGIERASSADRRDLEPSDTARLEAFEATTSRLVEFLGRMAVAVDEHGRQIGQVKEEAAQTSERVQAVEAALQRHGLL